MTTQTTTPVSPKFRKANVQPREIVQMDEFNSRATRPDKTLIRSLVQSLRIKGELDPILLWNDRSDPQNHRLVLLDGKHRLAAYRNFHRTGKGRSCRVPVRIVECDLKTALLLSLSANTKDCVPLTTSERTNAAWRLVRHPSIRFSKSELARASAVSPRTIANMRKRLKEMVQNDKEVTGNWMIDRQDKQGTGDFECSDDELIAKIEALTSQLQGPLGGWKRERTEVIAGALDNIFGHDLRYIFDHIYGEDEFAPDAITTETETYFVQDENDDF